MADSKKPTEIEREIEHERARLGDTISELQSRFTPDEMIRQVSREFQLHGGDIGRSLARSVKQNPIGLALTAAGIAWLVMGRSYDDEDGDRIAGDPVSRRLRGRKARRAVTHSYAAAQDDDLDYDDRDEVAGYEYDSAPRSAGYRSASSAPSRTDRGDWTIRRASYDSEYRPSYHQDLDDDHSDSLSFSERVDAAQQRIRARIADAQHSAVDGMTSAKDSAAGLGARAGDAASSAASRVAGTASSAASAVSGAVSGGVSALASAVSDRAAGLADRAGSVGGRVQSALEESYARIASGTEGLSESARERVIAAREKALIAREKAERQLRRAGNTASGLYEEYPLVAGAIAMAVGAAIGGAAPRTRIEDNYIGEYSDSLFDEAERIYREEKGKLGAIASAAMDEGKAILKDAKSEADMRTPGEKPAEFALADAARSAAERIEGRVREEAQRQNLGESVGTAVEGAKAKVSGAFETAQAKVADAVETVKDEVDRTAEAVKPTTV